MFSLSEFHMLSLMCFSQIVFLMNKEEDSLYETFREFLSPYYLCNVLSLYIKTSVFADLQLKLKLRGSTSTEIRQKS